MKKIGCLLPLLIVVIIVVSMIVWAIISAPPVDSSVPDAGATPEDPGPAEDAAVEVIVDATQFSRIDAAALIEILGDPSWEDSWNYGAPNGQKYAARTLTYDDTLGTHEFLLIDDQVMRYTIYASGDGLTYGHELDIFPMFGITVSQDLQIVASTPSARRYRAVTESIPELWIPSMNENVIEIVKFTYDLTYF